MKAILSILFICLIAQASNAEEKNDSNKVGSHNIGVAAGFITGYGLSYRQWFDRIGAQLTVAPFYNSDEYSSIVTVSTGLTALGIIKENRYVNLIAYAGPHYFYSKETRPTYETSEGKGSDTTETNSILFVGAGPGIDIHFLKISLNIMFGLLYRTDFDKSKGVNFSGETAIYYSF